MMNNIDRQYQALLQDILDSGVRKGDRTGTGTVSQYAIVKKTNEKVKVKRLGKLGYENIKYPFIPLSNQKQVYMKSELIFV